MLPFDTGQPKMLIQGGYWPRYLATSSKTGHLVYMHEGTLFGVGFDLQGLKLLARRHHYWTMSLPVRA